MSIRGAARVGLFIALIAAAWFGVQVQGSLAQTQSSDSPSESAKVPPQKESAPRKEAGISQNRYTTGLLQGPAIENLEERHPASAPISRNCASCRSVISKIYLIN